jgi:2-amino-4-hydroxy-6-hydroxymethyldihydropteridine diphosphokinase
VVTGTAYIALGANLGNRLRTLRQAVARLRDLGTIEAVSPVYETDPVGYAEQPPYLNAVVRLQTQLDASGLLGALLAIEADLGRIRSFRNAPRTVDLDLLFFDDLVVDTPGLRVPHPRLHERAFVLVPLSAIAPELIHPVLGRSIASLLADLGEISGVRPFDTL